MPNNRIPNTGFAVVSSLNERHGYGYHVRLHLINGTDDQYRAATNDNTTHKIVEAIPFGTYAEVNASVEALPEAYPTLFFVKQLNPRELYTR